MSYTYYYYRQCNIPLAGCCGESCLGGEGWWLGEAGENSSGPPSKCGGGLEASELTELLTPLLLLAISPWYCVGGGGGGGGERVSM